MATWTFLEIPAWSNTSARSGASPPAEVPARDPVALPGRMLHRMNGLLLRLSRFPLLDPLDFKADADYVMKTNGHVYDSSSTCLTCIPPSSVDNWKDGGGNDLWQYDPGNQAWIAKTDDLPNGIYYSEAAADLPTSPGLATCGSGGVDLTLIAKVGCRSAVTRA